MVIIRELRNDIGVSSYETEIKSKKEKVSIFQVIKEKPHLALPVLARYLVITKPVELGFVILSMKQISL